MGQAGNWEAMRLGRLATLLNLTESQKIAAQAIFNDARNAITPLLPAVRQAQQALRDAEKTATSDQQLQVLPGLAGKVAQAMTPIMGIRAQAQAKFYALLTQDQKDKLGQLRGVMRPGVRAGFRRSR
jgi:Spy/CpxP family protein refolding chaperone